MRVMTIVGTRPELIKLSRVIHELDRTFDHCLVHTGQNFDYELNDIFFKELEIRKPNHFLNCAGSSAVQTISQVLIKAEEVLRRERPDAVLIYGDTNSALAAIAVKKLQIPLFHMEAGNRCFDDRVPEEVNRRMVDHLSDINMPLTEHGRRYLLREGLKPDRIIKTGSCMFEILHHFSGRIDQSKVHKTLGLQAKNYYVASFHREENVDREESLVELLNSLNLLVESKSMPMVFSVHPRTQKRMDELKTKVPLNPLIQPLKPLGFFDYVRLQKEAYCVLSDSGTLMEECAILGFPAVHCRESFERPEGMEYGAFILSPIHRQQMLAAVHAATSIPARVRPVPDYLIDHVSQNVARIIMTYTPIVLRTNRT